MILQDLNTHVLLIYDQPEPRPVVLKSATYSIGRDKHNPIVIQHRVISRQHALLLRLPLPSSGSHRYRIIDGDSSGKASLNGLSVNGVECKAQDLNPNDIITLGSLIQIKYQVLNVPSNRKYFDYLKLQDTAYQSIKAKSLSLNVARVDNEDVQPGDLSTDQDILSLEDFDDDFYPTELFNGLG
ncbi:MAG: FHA domain-containing protein [Kovacikia sp.]